MGVHVCEGLTDRALRAQEHDVEVWMVMQDAHELAPGVAGGSQDGDSHGGVHVCVSMHVMDTDVTGSPGGRPLPCRAMPLTVTPAPIAGLFVLELEVPGDPDRPGGSFREGFPAGAPRAGRLPGL